MRQEQVCKKPAFVFPKTKRGFPQNLLWFPLKPSVVF